MGESDARDTVATGAIVCTLTLAAVYVVSRTGFDNPLTPAAHAVGLGLFHVTAPLVASKRLARAWSDRWWASQSFLTIAFLIVTVAAGDLAHATQFSIAPLVSVSGAVFAGVIVTRWLRHSTLLPSALFVTGAGIFSVWTAGVVWGTRSNKTPLFWETFSFNGKLHQDTFYLAAIANMIRTYGIPSTGLDGVPFIHYHYGSGWMFAQWADLIGTDVMGFYNLGYPIVVIPLFFGALLTLSVEVARRLPIDAFEQLLRRQVAVWVVIVAATIGILPERISFGLFLVWDPISESYLVGLAVFLLVIATALSYSGRRRRDSWSFFLVFVPLSLAALGFLKVSLMILLFAMGLYLVARLGDWRSWLVLASVLLSLIACVLVYRIVSLPNQNQGIAPFNFLRAFVAPGWRPFFPFVHLAWTWLFIGSRLWEERASSLAKAMQAIRSGRLIDAEIVFLVALFGFLPGEIVAIHGGSAFYFSDVQRWLAVGLMVGRISLWLGERGARRRIPNEEIRARKPVEESTLGPWTILGGAILAPLAVVVVLNTIRPPLQMARANVALRDSLIGVSQDGPTPSMRMSSITDGRLLAEGLAAAPRYSLVAELRRLNDLPEAEKSRSALFVPQSYAQFWNIFDVDSRCSFAPLVAPAASGIALIDGMPPPGCKLTDQYNMPVYHRRDREQTSNDVTARALCGKGRRKGFSEVIVIEPDPSGVARRRRLACGGS
jgi:hypothetical protein